MGRDADQISESGVTRQVVLELEPPVRNASMQFAERFRGRGAHAIVDLGENSGRFREVSTENPHGDRMASTLG